MDQNCRGGVREPLKVHEVPERIFEVVHAIYERKIEWHTAEESGQVMLSEELVTRLVEDAGPPPERESQLW